MNSRQSPEIEPRVPGLSSTTELQPPDNHQPYLQSSINMYCTGCNECFSHTLDSCVVRTLIGVDILSRFVVSIPDQNQSKHGSFSALHLHVILKVPDEVWARDYLLCKPMYRISSNSHRPRILVAQSGALIEINAALE